MNSLSSDDDVAARGFGLSHALVSRNRTLSLALTVGSSSFSLDTEELASNSWRAERKMKRKKPGPSTIRRSARRKEEFLKKKALAPLDHLRLLWKNRTRICPPSSNKRVRIRPSFSSTSHPPFAFPGIRAASGYVVCGQTGSANGTHPRPQLGRRILPALSNSSLSHTI